MKSLPTEEFRLLKPGGKRDRSILSTLVRKWYYAGTIMLIIFQEKGLKIKGSNCKKGN